VSTDPRITRSRDAILRAVVEIIQAEGPGAVTHQRVADRAGVGRATVYRHWPRPVDLVFEAMQQVDLPFLEPADGTLRERLRSDLRRLRDDLAAPIARSVIATIVEGAQRAGPYRDRSQRLAKTAVVNTQTAIDRAVETGELVGTPDADALVAQLLGAILFRRLIADRPATDDFIDHVVDAALAPWTPADPRPPRARARATSTGIAASP
jgi:AcrR family transcriptional regulator